MNERLTRQIAFLVEADKLKSVVRRTPLVDGSRLENSAEHSWHLVLVIMVLREYGPRDVDWIRVMEMVAVHDLVEIDAGDVSAYDVDAFAAKAVREQTAAHRIFGLLPADQQSHFRELWDEFEAKETAEARFATAVDRFQPMLLNCRSQGAAWNRHGVTHDRVVARNRQIADGCHELWCYAEKMLQDIVDAGHLPKG